MDVGKLQLESSPFVFKWLRYWIKHAVFSHWLIQENKDWASLSIFHPLCCWKSSFPWCVCCASIATVCHSHSTTNSLKAVGKLGMNPKNWARLDQFDNRDWARRAHQLHALLTRSALPTVATCMDLCCSMPTILSVYGAATLSIYMFEMSVLTVQCNLVNL